MANTKKTPVRKAPAQKASTRKASTPKTSAGIDSQVKRALKKTLKKTITSDNLLDKLEVIKVALQSLLATIEIGIPKSPAQKRSLDIGKAAFDQMDEISTAIKNHGFSPDLEDLHRIVNRAILSNRILIKDPNRVRAGEPVIYSSIHPEFPLDYSNIDLGKDAVIINVRKSKGPEKPSSKKGSVTKLKRGQKITSSIIPADSEI